MKRIYLQFILFLKDRFDLSQDQDNNQSTIDEIKKGIVFRGVNVWTLIFAIFVASIGLNVNSTAVIIGAMLISPLMGPIMGLGLSVGISDFSLLKKSLYNLTIAVVISILTSTLYFMVSPLNDAQSELLARTSPTIYDVLIALFGGLAGIVAGSTKGKGTAIPGVAIATALMPPLCTAGFGLATGNWLFFVGAFYLFFINAVMISLSTYLIVRFLRFPKHIEAEVEKERRVRKYLYMVTLLAVLPSIYMGYRIVQEAVYQRNASRFISEQFNSNERFLFSKSIHFVAGDSSTIELYLTGNPLDTKELDLIRSQLSRYKISKTKLVINQGRSSLSSSDIGQIKLGLIEELYRKNEQIISDKDAKIHILESQLLELGYGLPTNLVANEVKVLYPSISRFAASKVVDYNLVSNSNDTLLLVSVTSSPKLKSSDITRFNDWLRVRFNLSKVRVVME
ncbi:MAG: TIGR00341 family protein [Breznakibacter sp.]|nr:TIGR00341 family protein [Breznakibacter sp.]